jgi:hypothetical protein
VVFGLVEPKGFKFYLVIVIEQYQSDGAFMVESEELVVAPTIITRKNSLHTSTTDAAVVAVVFVVVVVVVDDVVVVVAAVGTIKRKTTPFVIGFHALTAYVCPVQRFQRFTSRCA